MQTRNFFGPVNLLLVGDSWTDDTYSHGQYSANWPSGLVVVNEGVSGLPISAAAGGSNSVESRIAGYLSDNSNTDICVVCSGGINDMAVATDQQIIDAMAAIVASIKSAGAVPVVVGIPRSSSWTSNGRNDRADTIEDSYRETYAAQGVAFVALKPFISDDRGIYAKYAEDALHLDENGANALGQAILSAIKVEPYRKKVAV